MSIEALACARAAGSRTLARVLRSAARSTGQVSFRFPEPWEDSVTMAAEASRSLLRDRPQASIDGLRYIAVGTETGVDLSKPIAAYVLGLLGAAGLRLPLALATSQVQHACAGGTLALAGVSALLGQGGRPGEGGIVICTDIARYESGGTAEITQGAAAVALLVESRPRLLALDLETMGFHSQDVDDFFRPIGSETARVKGSYSMQCYQDALEGALADHCRRRGEAPADVLRSTDFFVLHAPFRNMPEIAMKRLLARHLGLGEIEARTFLAQRALPAAVEAVSRVGNVYSGSLYLATASLLADRFAALGEGIRGRSMLMASYGSGNVMAVTAATIADGAPGVLAGWGPERLISEEKVQGLPEYLRWLASPLPATEHRLLLRELRGRIPAGTFCFEGVREDGYREYTIAG
jgi:hydroxymethylglutaryl-CoA synthase